MDGGKYGVKFQAQISEGGKKVRLGLFATAEEAALCVARYVRGLVDDWLVPGRQASRGGQSSKAAARGSESESESVGNDVERADASTGTTGRRVRQRHLPPPPLSPASPLPPLSPLTPPAPPSEEESFEVKVEIKQEDGSLKSTRETVPYSTIAVKQE